MVGKKFDYFRGLNLTDSVRVHCFHGKPVIDCDPIENKLSGFMGERWSAVFDFLGWKFRVVPGDNEMGNLDPKTGRWDGVYEQFQNNEVDMMLFPGNYDHREMVPVDFGHVVLEIHQRIRAYHNIHPKTSDLLESLMNVVPMSISISVAFTVLLISLCLFFITRKKVVGIIWALIRFFINQGDYAVHAFEAKLILTTFTLGSFFLIQYFSNMFSTSKISVDLSVLPQTLGDVIRLNMTPFLMKADLMLHKYSEETDPTSDYYKIWQMAKKNDLNITLFDLHPREGPKFLLRNNTATIAFKVALELGTSFSCKKQLWKPKNEQIVQWISHHDFNGAPFYFFRRKNMSREANIALDTLSIYFREYGTIEHMLSMLPHEMNMMDILFNAWENPCMSTDLAAIEQEQQDKFSEDVGFGDIRSVFKWLFICILFAGFVLVIELTFKRVYKRFIARNPVTVEPIRQNLTSIPIQTIRRPSPSVLDNAQDKLFAVLRKRFHRVNRVIPMHELSIAGESKPSQPVHPADKLSLPSPPVKITGISADPEAKMTTNQLFTLLKKPIRRNNRVNPIHEQDPAFENKQTPPVLPVEHIGRHINVHKAPIREMPVNFSEPDSPSITCLKRNTITFKAEVHQINS